MTAKTATKDADNPIALSTAPVDNPPTFTETVKVALYAEFGKKKTLQIAYLIETFGAENVLVVNAERGLSTIRSYLTVPENVLVVPNLKELRANFPKVQAFATGPDKYIALDGGSRVVSWMANEQLSGADRFYEAMKKGTQQNLDDLQYGRFIQKGEINGMSVYNRVGRDSETLWNAWVGLNANVYVNFLEEKTGTTGFEKTFPYGPDVPGKVGLTAVMSTFDFVGRLSYSTEGKLIGGFDVTTPMYLAKVRDDNNAGVKVPKELPDFNLAEFIKLVRGEPSVYTQEVK